MSRSKKPIPEIRTEVRSYSVPRLQCEKILQKIGMSKPDSNKKIASPDSSYQFLQWNDNPRENFETRIKKATEAARCVCAAIAPEQTRLFATLGKMEDTYIMKCRKIQDEEAFQNIFVPWLRELDFCLTHNLAEKLDNIPVMTWMDKANAYRHLLQPVAPQIVIRAIQKQSSKRNTRFYTLACSTPLAPLSDTNLQGFLYPDVTHRQCASWYKAMPGFEKKLFNHTFREFNCVKESDPQTINQRKEQLKARLMQLPAMFDCIPGISNFSREEFFYVRETKDKSETFFPRAAAPIPSKQRIGSTIYQATLVASQQNNDFFKAIVTRIVENYRQENPDLTFKQLRNKKLFLQLPPDINPNQLPERIKLLKGRTFSTLQFQYIVVNHSVSHPLRGQNLVQMAKNAIEEERPEANKLQSLLAQLEQSAFTDKNQQELHQTALESMIARRLGYISCSFFRDESRKKMQLDYEYSLETYWELYGALPRFSVTDDKSKFIALFMKISELEKGSTKLPTLEDAQQVHEKLVDWTCQSIENHTFSMQKEAWTNRALHTSRLHGAAKGFAVSAPFAITAILVLSVLAFYITIPFVTILLTSTIILGCFTMIASTIAGAAIEDFEHKNEEAEKWGNRQLSIARANPSSSQSQNKYSSLRGFPDDESASREESTSREEFVENFPLANSGSEEDKYNAFDSRKGPPISLSVQRINMLLSMGTPLIDGNWFSSNPDTDKGDDISLSTISSTDSESSHSGSTEDTTDFSHSEDEGDDCSKALNVKQF